MCFSGKNKTMHALLSMKSVLPKLTAMDPRVRHSGGRVRGGHPSAHAGLVASFPPSPFPVSSPLHPSNESPLSTALLFTNP